MICTNKNCFQHSGSILVSSKTTCEFADGRREGLVVIPFSALSTVLNLPALWSRMKHNTCKDKTIDFESVKIKLYILC